MTAIEMIDAARKILKEKLPSTRSFPDNSSGFLEDSEMLDWLNWSVIEYQAKLVQTFEGWFITATSITVNSTTDEYAMPSGCLKVVRVEDATNPNDPMEVLPITFNDKDQYLRKTWTDITGTSPVQFYSIRGNKFVLRPIPSTGCTLKVFYERRADPITSATDTCVLPNEYHELVVWGIVENGLIKKEATAEAMASILGRRNRLVDDLMKTGEDRQVQRSRTVRRKKGRG